eukprot:TRINITY_DN4691_c0_g1_i1.p2 TRINITY_DN4691_c0_g1~~TRINITY_DN4691_c0_g1_i1.p2  ORF type:complete len:98 (-),score=12.90 TRINITY_DN4691_c0_g1_i1:129-422(-)
MLRNFAFVRLALVIAALFFGVTAIQFWYSDYAITVIGIRKEVVFTCFGLVSVTGPVLGVVFGGWAMGKIGVTTTLVARMCAVLSASSAPWEALLSGC